MKLKAKGKYKFIRHGGKTIQEHQVIGRRLFRRRSNWTMRIHHKNGDKSDNTPDNLELLSTQNHSRLHAGWERIGKNIVTTVSRPGLNFLMKRGMNFWR